MSSGSDTHKQHTYIETEAVRYVYQPLDNTLYLLLITNRASNIVEDLDTLRLLSKVVPNITGTTGNLTDEKVVEKSFDLIFAFDEVITSGGYRESITLSQIRTNMEMDSHEEKLHNMIKQSKMESAKDQAAAAAKSIKEKQREQLRTTGSAYGSSYDSSSSSSALSSTSPVSTPSNITSSPVVPSSSSLRGQTLSQPVKGMSLGNTGRTKAFEDALMKEDKLAPITPNVTKAPSVDHHGVTGVTAAPAIQHPLMFAVTEKISAKISKDGMADLFEVKGNLMLTAATDDVSNCIIKLKPLSASHSKSFAFTTHPKINKAIYEKSSVLQLKDSGKGFPSGRPVGILKWSSNADSTEDLIPLRINCWPEEEARGQVNVSIEYSMDLKNFELHEVKIRIPLGTSATPNVASIDGSYKHSASTNELIWEIDLIDSSNSSGSLEFNIQQKNVDAFFPIQVHFSSMQLYCPLDIIEVTSVANTQHIPYGLTKGLSNDEYIIG
jgi:hypothetical protein